MVAGIGIENLLWLKPVYAGDILSSVFKITNIVPSENKKTGTIYGHYETKNQDGVSVLSMDVKYLVKSKN